MCCFFLGWEQLPFLPCIESRYDVPFCLHLFYDHSLISLASTEIVQLYIYIEKSMILLSIIF